MKRVHVVCGIAALFALFLVGFAVHTINRRTQDKATLEIEYKAGHLSHSAHDFLLSCLNHGQTLDEAQNDLRKIERAADVLAR